MEIEDLDRLARIRLRLADWFNPPNGVNVKLSAIGGRKGTIRHVAALFDNAAADLQYCVDEIRWLRAQRDLLLNAARAECAKFAFPDEDRPELHEALKEAERGQWKS